MKQSDRQKLLATAIKTHSKLVRQLQASHEKLLAAAELLGRSLKEGGTVYICGNGGSAADAQHIAGELVGRFVQNRRALAAVALTTDSSVITAVANDYGYAHTFSRQVEALVGRNDVLWAISTSGCSENVLAAAGLARKKGAKVLAFTGRADCPLEKMADVCLCAAASTTARSQEIHQLAYHIICELVENEFLQK